MKAIIGDFLGQLIGTTTELKEDIRKENKTAQNYIYGWVTLGRRYEKINDELVIVTIGHWKNTKRPRKKLLKEVVGE